MTAFFRTLERVADALMIALFGLIFALVLAQVVCRYGFGSPLTWSEELARLAFMWLGMLAWSLGSRRRSHIAITFFAERMPAVARQVLAVAVQAAIVIFCLLLVWHGTTLAARNVGLPSVTVPIDFAVIYAIVPVGAAMMILYALREIHAIITGNGADSLTRDYVAVIEPMLWIIAGWLIVMLLGVPIFASLGLAAAAFVWWGGFPGVVIPQKVVQAVNSFPLLAAPFFILMGNLMNSAGITDRIFRFAKVMVGWWRGGLCHANILGSVIFAGMSGSAVADAAGLGTVEIKAMKDAGYDAETAAAVTAASATIGPIIPPSLPMIVYGVVAETSIGGLFIGAIIPGFLMAGALMLLVWRMAVTREMPREKFPSAREAWDAFKGAFWALMAPVLMMAGMLSGVFTPTEAAAVSAFYALVLGLFVYRDFRIRDLPKVILDTIETTGVVLAIVMCAVLFGWALSISRFPQFIGTAITDWSTNPLVILLLVNVLLLIVGCFMESIAALLILVPILVPVAIKVGIDPIQFGVIFVLNLMIGTLTPPVGIVLFVVAKVAELPFERVTRATLPFLVPLVAVLVAITLWPPLTTWLPGLVFGR